MLQCNSFPHYSKVTKEVWQSFGELSSLNMKRHFMGLMQDMEMQKREAMSHTDLELCDCIFSLLIYGKLVLQYLREVWGESSC